MWALVQVVAWCGTCDKPVPKSVFAKICNTIWVRSRNCVCLVTWFCYQLTQDKTAAVSWPDPYGICRPQFVNTLRPRQNGRHFADDIFKCIFLNENVWISITISLNCFPQGPINDIPALIQIMAWHAPGDKPLFEPMMMRLPTHICVTRPQWVKGKINKRCWRLCPKEYTPNSFQSFTWANDDQDLWCILDCNELVSRSPALVKISTSIMPWTIPGDGLHQCCHLPD